MSIDLSTIVAAPYHAPRNDQVATPHDMYGYRPAVMNSPDLQRILSLPRRALELDGTERAEAIIDSVTALYSRGNVNCKCAVIDEHRHKAEGCITRLRLVQALALREIAICGGLLGPIGVGHGKTLIDLLAPLALARHAASSGNPLGEHAVCVLFVPPKLLLQLSGDYAYIGEHFYMPSMIVQKAHEYDRIQVGAPKLQVMPYSLISRPEATAWMNVVKPYAIIADECHRLRNVKKPGKNGTATANRVAAYMNANPYTRGCFWSGSLTSKSLSDYDHMADWALRGGSPVPRDQDTVADWCRTLDPQKQPADPGALLEGLISHGFCKPGESLYTGFRARLLETLGVVSASQPSVDCKLSLLERKITTSIPAPIVDHIKGALAQVRPDGEELVTAMEGVECAIQIACGFHYRWIFPRNVFPRDEALIDHWRLCRKEWHKEQRDTLKHPSEHMDSPKLLENAADRHYGFRPATKGLPTWASQTYLAWREIRGQVYYESVPVRLDDFFVRDVCDWMQNHNGIVWYWHRAFGEWVAEMSGNVMFGAGKENAKALVEERGDRPIIVSAKAHREGTNGLQFNFHEMYFTNPPGEPAAWEQTLGRLHRPGQKHPDGVIAYYAMHTPELRKRIRTALGAAYYVQGTGMGDQKLHVGFPDGLEELSEDEE